MPFPVTYLIDRPAPSETFIRREIELLRRCGWPLHLCFLTGPDALRRLPPGAPPGLARRVLSAAAARLAQESLRSPATALRLLARLPQAADLARLAAANGSRLIHAQFAGPTADLAAQAARALGLPWTCSVHARDVFATPPGLLRRRLASAHAITACSQQAAEAVAAAGLPRSRLSVIRHGLPLDAFPFQDAPRVAPLILTACRLTPKKGVDTLLDACARLRAQALPFVCEIAGDGPLHAALAAQARRLGLSDAVRFLGWLPEERLRARLAQAAVLALPSRRLADGDRDGIANVLAEALALGTPVVTTDAGAACEILRPEENARLVPPDAPDALADALAGLLRDPDLRNRLAAAGRRTAETLLDGAANIRQLEALFERAAR